MQKGKDLTFCFYIADPKIQTLRTLLKIDELKRRNNPSDSLALSIYRHQTLTLSLSRLGGSD